MGDWLGRGGTTISVGLVCEGFAGFAGFFDLVSRACLRHTVTLGADLPFLMAFVTSPCTSEVSPCTSEVTGPEVGRGLAGGVALTTRTRGSSQVLGSPARRLAPLGSP